MTVYTTVKMRRISNNLIYIYLYIYMKQKELDKEEKYIQTEPRKYNRIKLGSTMDPYKYLLTGLYRHLKITK